jgi:hypothetical protein
MTRVKDGTHKQVKDCTGNCRTVGGGENESEKAGVPGDARVREVVR